MEKEYGFFKVMKQFPKSFRVVVYLFFSIILITLCATQIYNARLIPNFKADNYFSPTQNLTLIDSNKIKLDSIQNEAYIKRQIELLGIDTLRIKYGLEPISNPIKYENGNLIDNGPISNIIYYAILIAIVIVAFTFKNSTSHLYLILNFCFALLLIGLFALLKGIMTPTNFKGFNFDIRTASVGATICLFATIIVFRIVGKIERQKLDNS